MVTANTAAEATVRLIGSHGLLAQLQGAGAMAEVLTLLANNALELVSILGVIAALLISARQNNLTSRAIRAQSFVNLFDLEIQSGFQDGIIKITALKKYNSFAEFGIQETHETKMAIYRAVVFLNLMAVLGEEEYLHIQDAWDVYFWSYRKCYEKLLPWWIEGQRATQPNAFPSFERACMVTHMVSEELIRAFDRRIGVKHLDKYHRASRIPRRKLRDELSTQFSRVTDH